MTTELRTSRPVRTFGSSGYTSRFSVADDGTVSAWDAIAGHYTLCHSLSAHQQVAIRRLAR